MKLITYQLDYTTWTVWTAGLLVKDAITLVLDDENTGELIYIEVMINYSARGYGRMTKQKHYYLNGRIFDKHWKYMDDVDAYRIKYVMPKLDALIGEEFKSVNHFIRKYNGR